MKQLLELPFDPMFTEELQEIVHYLIIGAGSKMTDLMCMDDILRSEDKRDIIMVSGAAHSDDFEKLFYMIDLEEKVPACTIDLLPPEGDFDSGTFVKFEDMVDYIVNGKVLLKCKGKLVYIYRENFEMDIIEKLSRLNTTCHFMGRIYAASIFSLSDGIMGYLDFENGLNTITRHTNLKTEGPLPRTLEETVAWQY
jgi:hypothetical protein